MSFRWLAILLATLLISAASGCGSTPQKDAEKGKDMPKPADKDG
jgi:hypothetical protein